MESLKEEFRTQILPFSEVISELLDNIKLIVKKHKRVIDNVYKRDVKSQNIKNETK